MANETGVSIKTDGMTAEQVELIKTTVAKGATDNELKLFLMVAKRSGLDPFTKQIHFVKRKTKFGEVGTIQTGIDGFRAIGERSGTLAGIDDAVFDTEMENHPGKASVTVWRIVNDIRVSFTASARWAEYAQPGSNGYKSMWDKMPYLMLGKCAEALALRKAFPNDLSGLYTNEEMQQAEGETVEPKVRQVMHVQHVSVTGTDTDDMPEDEPEAPVVPPKGPSTNALKKSIADSLKALGMPCGSPKEAAESIKKTTELEYTPENLRQIADTLKGLVVFDKAPK